MQITGLPTGVSVSTSSLTLFQGSGQYVSFSAAANAPAMSGTIMFTGSAGSLKHTSTLNVTVAAPLPATLSTRTKYVRTDAVVEYWQWVNSHWEVLHTPTSRVFVTDPLSNRIFVFDSTSEKEIATIFVPGAYSIDETADQSTLYVGTLIGDIYTIDPVAMAVTKRYAASEIGPNGYPAISALPLADGRMALLGEPNGLEGVELAGVDGFSSIAIWNPADNSISQYGGFGSASPLCGNRGSFFGFALTSDRQSILVGGEEQGSGFCEMNATTGSYITATPSGSPLHFVESPDGKYLAFPTSTQGAAIYDAHTLTLLNQFSVAGDTAVNATFVFSGDSQTLFVQGTSSSEGFGDGVVYAYNIVTGQLIGWLPDLFVTSQGSGFALGRVGSPNYEVADKTGLLIGPLEEGLGFLDTSAIRQGSVGTLFSTDGAGFLEPATGPTAGGTIVQQARQIASVDVTAMYFGSQVATDFSLSTPSNLGSTFSATTPPGPAGPVPVYKFMADGGMQLIPDGFSYGPTILEAIPNLATADGGGTGVLYGYGFGPVGTTNVGSTLPMDVSVSVAGAPAKITGAFLNSTYSYDTAFLWQSLSYVIPPGNPGSGADVAIDTDSGIAIAKAAVTYLPATKQFPLPGSALAQGVYDPVRDLYYFTDASMIRVFSLSQQQWMAPINVPNARRLWGVALSPDSSKLVATDMTGNVVFLIDPSNPSSQKAFPMPVAQGQTTGPAPIGVAVANSGLAYIVTTNTVLQLDTGSGTFTDTKIGMGSNTYSPIQELRTEISSDSSRVYFDALGTVTYIETATGDHFSNLTACCGKGSDLALSQDQSRVVASQFSYDADLNPNSFLTLNDRESQGTTYVYGVKLSPDGGLLFQPSTNGIDIFDGRLGVFLDRLALPFALATNYDALVEDGKDNVLLAITGANGDGIAVVDLTSIAEPSPLPYAVRGRLGFVGSPANTDASAPRIEANAEKIHQVPYRIHPSPLAGLNSR